MRGLLVFVIALAVGGCASPAAPPSGSTETPAAEATSVRKTAVAEVQRIIAGPQPPTDTPAPRDAPAPHCQGAIWWHQAAGYLGKAVTVEGPVVRSRPALPRGTLLEIGQPYPDPTGFTASVAFAGPSEFSGQTVCVTGRVESAEGLPTLQVADAAKIVVVK